MKKFGINSLISKLLEFTIEALQKTWCAISEWNRNPKRFSFIHC